AEHGERGLTERPHPVQITPLAGQLGGVFPELAGNVGVGHGEVPSGPSTLTRIVRPFTMSVGVPRWPVSARTWGSRPPAGSGTGRPPSARWGSAPRRRSSPPG